MSEPTIEDMSEPTIEEWFMLFIKSRDAAKKALDSSNTRYGSKERYESIMTDADNQIRASLDRINQLTRENNNDHGSKTMINDFLAKHNISRYRLAQLLGLPQTTMRSWAENGTHPETMRLALSALGKELEKS